MSVTAMLENHEGHLMTNLNLPISISENGATKKMYVAIALSNYNKALELPFL